MELNLTDAQKAEIAALRAMAEAKYEIDGGEMCECFDGQDYLEAIVKHGTADAAWAMHMRSVEAGREACGWHEAQAEIKAFEMTPEEVAEVAMYFPTAAQRRGADLDNPTLADFDSLTPAQQADLADAAYECEWDRSRNVNHFWPGAGTSNVPESAAHCEFGQMEYEWRLCRAGM